MFSLESGAVNVDPNDPLQSCCICYHAYDTTTTNEDAEFPVQLPCGHIFGTVCISKWLSIHNTCPLCRYTMSDTNPSDHEYALNTWLNEYDSGFQTFGTPPELVSTNSVIPSLINSWERAMGPELMLSSAHMSISTLHTPEAQLAACPAHQQHTRHSPSARLKARRCSCRSNTSALCHDESWLTALSDEEDQMIAFGSEDIWISLTEDDDDELELRGLFSASELSSCILEEFCFDEDSVFDNLYADHLQWMEELKQEIEWNTYDEFDYLV